MTPKRSESEPAVVLYVDYSETGNTETIVETITASGANEKDSLSDG